MNVLISNQQHRMIWDEVWSRIPLLTRTEMTEFLGDIREIPHYDVLING